MKNDKGITITSLIITIIVMVILAGIALLFSVGENGILEKTQEAKENQKYATIEERIKSQSEYISEGKNIGKIDLAKLESNINSLNLEEVEEINTTPNLLTVKLKDGSVIEIPGANGNLKLNEYGFAYNIDYVCYDWYNKGRTEDSFKAKILEDGTFVINTYENFNKKEGMKSYFTDFTGTKIYEVDSIEYNKEYTGIGALESNCKWVYDEKGNLKANIIISKEKLTYSMRNINIGGILNCIVAEDGKSFTLNNGKIFAIEE